MIVIGSAAQVGRTMCEYYVYCSESGEFQSTNERFAVYQEVSDRIGIFLVDIDVSLVYNECTYRFQL